MSTRRDVAQRAPSIDLGGFPCSRLRDAVYRAARRSPWWFCTCGDCRFDLPAGSPSGMGTLYAGTDRVTGVVEVIGPELVGSPIARSFLAERTVWRLGYDRHLVLADLCHQSAIGFGITNELSSMVPYEIPQAWAAAFADLGLDGIGYRTRFSTGVEPTGLALFDEAGEHDWIAEVECRADDASIVAELRRRHIEVADVPMSASLDIIG